MTVTRADPCTSPVSPVTAFRRVTAMPLLSPVSVLAARRPMPWPLTEPGTTLWHGGRTAIWQGLHALGLEPGARVLAPAYSCGSELDTLYAAGMDVDLYRIRPDLSVDFEHLEQLCRAPAAVLYVTHFFGLPQPADRLRALADRHGMLLVEDACHALFSTLDDGRPVGCTADMAVFSLWKTLSIPDGGALWLRPGLSLRHPLARGESPAIRSVCGRIWNMSEERLSRAMPRTVATLRRRVTEPLMRWLVQRLAGDAEKLRADGAAATASPLPPEAAQVAFRTARARWRMSAFATRLLPRIARHEILRQRRGNFEELQRLIVPAEDVRPLIDVLPRGACPLFLPVVARDPRPFCRYLASHGVGFFRAWCVFHPRVDWDLYPLEARLKEQVVVLPVHQDLDARDVEHVAAVVNAWNAGARR